MTAELRDTSPAPAFLGVAGSVVAMAISYIKG
jgi:hypothetical protein